MPDFEGYLLRKPRFAENERDGPDPDTFVRAEAPRDISADQAAFLKGYVGPDPGEHEYMVRPSWNGDLLAETITEEISESVGGDYKLFRFNRSMKKVDSVISVSPNPDSVDEQSGLIEYGTDQQGSLPITITYTVEELAVDWIRNGDVRRFGWSDKQRAWVPYCGDAPIPAGELKADGTGLKTGFTGDWSGPLQLAVGGPENPSGPTPPLEATPVAASVFESYSGPGAVTVDVALNEETGEMLASSSVRDAHQGSVFFVFREDFRNPDEADGVIGEVGETLVLNPVPRSSNKTTDYRRPLVRIGSRRYLDLEPEDSFSSLSFSGVDGYWHVETGEIRLSPSVDSEYGGETVIYDGVLNNTTPSRPGPVYDMGTLDTSNFNSGYRFGTTPALTLPSIPADVDLDEVYLFDKDESDFVPFVEVVPSSDDFKASVFLDPDKVQVAKDTREVNVAVEYVKERDGHTLSVMNPDFDVENGVSFRLPKSDDTLDGTYVKRLEREEVSGNVRASHFLPLTELPLLDLPGVGDAPDRYFELKNGPGRKVLKPGEDIERSFDENRLYWVQKASESRTLNLPTTSVQLGNQVLAEGTFEADLDVGEGFSPVPPTDYLLDEGAGMVTFVEEIGSVSAEGSATPSSPDVLETAEDLSSVKAAGAFGDLIAIVEDEAYGVADVVQSGSRWQVKTDPDLTSGALSQNEVAFAVRRGMEDVRRVGFVELNPSPEEVKAFLRTPVDTNSPGFVPEVATLRFLEDGNAIPHVVLERKTLGILPTTGTPVNFAVPKVDASEYYSDASRFKVYREGEELTHSTSSPPPSGQFHFDSANYRIEFDAAWAHQNAGSRIRFVPELKSNRASGPVEVLESGAVGLPDDVSGELFAETPVDPDDFDQTGRTLLFDRPFQGGEGLRTTYEEDGNPSDVEVGFLVRETVPVQQGHAHYSFASGVSLLPGAAPQVLVNGYPSDAAKVDVSAKTVELTTDLSNRMVQVAYEARRAQGGETSVDLPGVPDRADLRVEEGDSEVVLPGDFTGDIASGDILVIQDQSFEAATVSWDASASETTVTLNAEVVSEIRNPDSVFVTDRVPLKSLANVYVEAASAGEREITVVGSVADRFQSGHAVYLDGDPYVIDSSDESEERTSVKLETVLLRDYARPVVELTDKRIYQPGETELYADRQAVTAEGFELVRFDQPSGVGRVLTSPDQYTFDDNGIVSVRPDNVTPPASDDVWKLAYVGREEIGPKTINGMRFDPVLTASYSHRVAPSEENGFLGGRLTMTGYSRRPDSFYFRVTPLEDFGADAMPDVAGCKSSGFNIETKDRGTKSHVWDEGHHRDLDRLAVNILDFYHQVCTRFEQLLETAEGSLVGDSDGRFKYHIPDNGLSREYITQNSESTIASQTVPRGAQHPVTGDIVPYFANPKDPGDPPTATEIEEMRLEDQNDHVRNQIDDFIVVKKSPVHIEITSSFPFLDKVYDGTVKRAWEPSRFSRFYPKMVRKRAVTSPSTRSDFDPTNTSTYEYRFFDDFNKFMADLQADNIQSVRDLRERGAVAWIQDPALEFTNAGRSKVKLQVAGHYDELKGAFEDQSGQKELERGYPDEFRPAFHDGTDFDPHHVSLGRVLVKRNGEESYSIEVHVYALNMIVDSFNPAAGEVVIKNNPWAGQSFQGFNPYSDIEITDVKTLHPAFSSAGASLDPVRDIDGTQATLAVGDTLFSRPPVVVDTSQLDFGKLLPSPPFYRPGFDVGLDSADGTLVNKSMPRLFRNLTGQDPPDSLSYLEAEVVRPNPNLRPERFPALDGETVDDDGDRKAPLAQPLGDAELPFLNRFRDSLDRVINRTSEGFLTGGTVYNGNTIDLGVDLSAFSPTLSKYDRVLFEGVTSGGQSVQFDFSRFDPADSERVQLAAWKIEDSSVEYALDSIVDGTGERDAGNHQRWNDASVDFSGFSGAATGTLVVESTGNTYSVTNWQNGYVEVASNITETSSGLAYHVEITGTGATIGPDLIWLNDSGIDFSSAPSGGANNLEVTSSSTGVHNATYTVDRGESGRVAVRTPNIPADGSTLEVSLGRGTAQVSRSGSGSMAVTAGGSVLYTDESVADVDVGEVVVIPSSSTNGGRYLITDVVKSAGESEIHVSGTFRASEGTVGGPYASVDWQVRNPRRFSGFLEELRDVLRSGRPLFLRNNDNPPSDLSAILDASVDNPSAPYRDRLDELRELLADTTLTSSSGSFASAISGTGVTLQDSNVNFSTADLEKGDYVIVPKRDNVRDGKNRGFYKVTEVQADEVHLDGTSVTYQNLTPQAESGLEYRVVRPDERFEVRTVELVMDQIGDTETVVELLDRVIRSTIHEPQDLENGGDRGGDPSDALLNQFDSDAKGRYDWVSGDNSTNPFLRNEVRKVLSPREKLYDTRYAWIDYRINREDGAVVSRERSRERGEGEDEKRRREKQRRRSIAGTGVATEC